jgi:hypothetical protein
MLTLFFLQSSRAIRPAWLLEELNVSYDLKFANRQSDGTVPDALGVPTAVGKSPAIQDGDFILGESGAITEYVTGDIRIAVIDTSKLTSSNTGISARSMIRNIDSYHPTRSSAPKSAN